MSKMRTVAAVLGVTAAVIMGFSAVSDTATGVPVSRVTADSGHESKFPTPTPPPPAEVSMAVTTTTAAATGQ